MNYDLYNREERYVCAHLFRLLHEPVDAFRPLRRFLGDESDVDGFRIFAEVALIRDAYHERRADPATWMDALVRLVMAQEAVGDCRLYSELPSDLRSPDQTYPRQIRMKAQGRLSAAEQKVYGAIQGMFNAKPDLAICVGDSLLVYEAKLTLGFDQVQLRRTRNIAEVWAQLLYDDLGFRVEPKVELLKLGLSKHGPDISWEKVLGIAKETYSQHDRTLLALRQAVHLQGCVEAD